MLIFRSSPFIVSWFSKSQDLISHVPRADRSVYLGVSIQDVLYLNVLVAYHLLVRISLLSFFYNSLLLQLFHSETVLIPEPAIFGLSSSTRGLHEFLDERGILLPVRDVVGATTLPLHREVLFLVIFESLLSYDRHSCWENSWIRLWIFGIRDSYLNCAASCCILFSWWPVGDGGYPLTPEIIWTDLLLWYNFHHIRHFGFFLILNDWGPFLRNWRLPWGDHSWDGSYFDINSKVILQLLISAREPLAFLAKQLVLLEAYGYVWNVVHYYNIK